MTLLEVMIATAFVALLVSGIYAGMVQAVGLNYAVAQRVCALGLCRERIEQMRAVDYSSVTATNFDTEILRLTHLGGSARLPLPCTRSSIIASLNNPVRKAVTVMVAWNFRGRPYQESVSGMIFDRDASASPVFGGAMGGEININPNNRPDNEFTLTLPDSSTITRDDLTQDYPGYTGSATLVHVKPKGNGNQNDLLLNMEVYTLLNAATYDIASDSMTVDLYNDHINPQGKAVGKWWIAITATDATIMTN